MKSPRPLDGKPQVNSQGNLRKGTDEAERPSFGVKNNHSQLIHIKKKPAQLTEEIEISSNVNESLMQPIFNFGVKSRAGRVGTNRKINQDNYVTNQLFMGSQENSFFCVLDGHGNDGHKVSHYLKMNLSSRLVLYQTALQENSKKWGALTNLCFRTPRTELS
jgi:hypothetical protein